MRNLLQLAWKRICDLAIKQSVEWSEGISILSAFAWFVPLLTQPGYLGTSPGLRNVDAYLTRPVALVVFGLLLACQSFAVLFGGHPSAFFESLQAARFWYTVRGVLLLLCCFVWWSLAFILTLAGFGVGTLLWGGIGLLCAVGVWRMTLLMAVEVRLYGLREKRIYAKSPEGYALARSVEAASGKRSLLKPVPPTMHPRTLSREKVVQEAHPARSERGRNA